jgi:hypothetical protein
MDQVRALTRRRVPLKTKELIERLNPLAWLGQLLQKGSRPKALQPTEPLDPATDLVASIQAMAQYRLASATRSNAVQGIRAGQSHSS